MRAALLLLVSVTALAQGRSPTDRACDRYADRSSRGYPCDSRAFEEFAPADGAGMSAVCAGTPITTARGKAVTVARTGTSTCTKTASGGRATTGISNGDVVSISANLPRVEYDSAGYRGLRVEPAGTNNVLRSAELCDAAWTAVANCSDNTARSPDGNVNADELTDSDVGAIQGITQSITTTSQTTHTFSCYAQSVDLAKVTVSITGTGNSAGDCTGTSTTLSTTTWSRVSCTSSAAYGAGLSAVTVAVGVGTVVGDEGTINVWGCQHEIASTGATSYIPTTSAAVTRGAEQASISTTSWGTSTSISVSGYIWGPPRASGGAEAVFENTGLNALVNESAGPMRWYTSGGSITVSMIQPTTILHWYVYHSGTARGLAWGANSTSGANTNSNNKFAAQTWFGGSISGGGAANGIVSRYCIDPSWQRCR